MSTLPKARKSRYERPSGFPPLKKGTFQRPHTLHWEGKPLALEIWFAPNHGFWIVCKSRNITVHAGDYDSTWLAFTRALDPEIEELRRA